MGLVGRRWSRRRPDRSAGALERYPNAKHHYDAFQRSPKRGFLEWIKQVKKPETRAKPIEETARLVETNDRASQFKR